MAFDANELKFCGMVETAAEGEFSASMFDDTDMCFAMALYAKYVAEGKPKGTRGWISRELSKHFVCLAARPVWIESLTTPVRPFLDGRPMFFVDQVTVAHAGGGLVQPVAGTVLYIFGSCKPMSESPGGDDVLYRVVEQHQGL